MTPRSDPVPSADRMFAVDYLGFPRRTRHVLLPARPAAAARAGLALYDSTLLHQRIAAAVGNALFTLHLQRVFRIGSLPQPLVPTAWWSRWCKQVAVRTVGEVGCAAFRLWEDRIIALLMTDAGKPRGFVKVWRNPPGPPRPHHDLQPDVVARLCCDSRQEFRVPALLDEGTLDGWYYELFEPLPPGTHRPLPADPARVAGIFDTMHERLSSIPRPSDVPAHYVIAHGDFTPRNVRLASDGHAWIVDWEYACWAPPLLDELHFWTAEFARRVRPRPARDGVRVLELLRTRGSDADIAEAFRGRMYMPSVQRAIADAVAREVGSTSTELMPAAGEQPDRA
jgi:hypothetical protein